MRKSAAQSARHRERQVARRVAADLLAGGTFRAERRHDRTFDHLVLDSGDYRMRLGLGHRPRWRGEKTILQPGELLVIDPSQLPEGTEVGLVKPERLRPPLAMWLRYQEVGLLLVRSQKTMRNLVAKHRLERRTFWDGRGRHRKRMTLLPPATVHRLAELSGKGFLKL